jgi:hypothetical protein
MLEAVACDNFLEICWITDKIEARLLQPAAAVLLSQRQDDRRRPY